MARISTDTAAPVEAVIIFRNMGPLSSPKAEIIAVSSDSMETSAAARLITLTASMTGLPFFRYFTKLITAIVMAKKV